MIKTTLNFNVNNLLKMRDEKKTLDLNHIVQRGFVWAPTQASLLIHSILSSFPVPPIYCLKVPGEKETTYSILDGKQRITSVLNFVSGEYPLDEDTPSITWDDEEVELANCYFDDLPQDIQQELLHFKFLIYGFEDITNDEIGELFYRLNNGYLLNKTQKSLSCVDFGNASFIKELLNSKFFTTYCKFTPLQRKNSADLATLLQAMILFHNKYYEYKFSSISDAEILSFANYIKNNYSEEMKTKLSDIIAYLELVFHKKEKQLKKINIPMIMLCGDIALGDNYNMEKKLFRIGPKYFYHWFTTFFEEELESYSPYCSTGSTKLEKTMKRIEVMQKSLISYFELDDVSSIQEKEDVSKQLEVSEPEDVASCDEHENVSLTDSIMADMEQPHIPPDEENNEN